MSNKKTDVSGREKLIGLLTQQLGLYRQIQELCEDQTKLLGNNDFDGLNKSLEQGARLRTKINGLHQETEALMQSYALSAGINEEHGKHKRGHNDDMPADAEIEKLTGQIQDTILLCAKLNDENTERIKLMSGEHSKKIDEQRAKREGIAGYAQAVAGAPEMFDKKT